MNSSAFFVTTLLGVTALAAFTEVQAFDCTSHHGKASLVQELTTKKDGGPSSVGPIGGDVTVEPEAGKCRVDINLSLGSPPSVDVGSLSWYERPSSNTNAGRKIGECKVANGPVSCHVPDTSSGVDSLALYSEASKSVYAVVNFAKGKKTGENTGNAVGNKHDDGNTTVGATHNGNDEPAAPPTLPPLAGPGKPQKPEVVTYHPSDGSPPYECIPRVGDAPVPPQPQLGTPGTGEFPIPTPGSDPNLPPVAPGGPPLTPPTGEEPAPPPMQKVPGSAPTATPLPDIPKNSSSPPPLSESPDDNPFPSSASIGVPRLGYASTFLATALSAVVLAAVY